MLKGISPLISPDLLNVMARMGHGDELVLADAHFLVKVSLQGLSGPTASALPIFLRPSCRFSELDSYVPHPLIMMEPVPGDSLDPGVEISYLERIMKEVPVVPPVKRIIDRFAFYERAAKAFAVVMTRRLPNTGILFSSRV